MSIELSVPRAAEIWGDETDAVRAAVEWAMNAIYARAAHEPVTLWDLPDVDHTAALTQRPQEYERQVIGHLDRALLGGP